jgi:probable HAF family extracellular repeat protein
MICSKTRGSRTGRIALGTLGLAAALAAPSRAAVQYTVTDLAPTPIGIPIQATSINNAHQIAGKMNGWGTLFQQMRWQGTVLSYLPTTSGGGPILSRGAYVPPEPDYPTFPTINAGGKIASLLGNTLSGQPIPLGGGNGPQAAIWSGNTPTTLGTLGGRASAATGINDTGTPVGWSYTANDAAIQAFRYEPLSSVNPSPVMRDLGTLGGTYSAALGVNRSKWTVGWSDTAGGATHAFLDVPKVLYLFPNFYYYHAMYDMQTLGGTNSKALAINDNGVAVGYADVTGDLRTEAFLCQLNAAGGVVQRTSLGRLGYGLQAIATDINNAGKVVGYGLIDDQKTYHAWVWEPGLGMRDLNTLIPANSGWVLTQARSINESGEIVGYGYRVTNGVVDPALQIHPFLLKPIL